MTRYRRFVFTCNNYESIPTSISSDVRYLLFAEEIAPTTGTPHIQGYVEFYRQEYFSTIQQILQNLFGNSSHIAPARGTVQQQIVYISKQNTPIEFGTPANPGTRNDLVRIRELLDRGMSVDEIAEIDFGAYVRYNRAFDRYVQSRIRPRMTKSKVIYIYGPTGSGKTTRVYEECPDVTTVEFDGRFFSRSPKKVLFDDVDPNTFSRQIWLRLLDKWPYQVRVLGNYIEWNPEVIYITSNYNPEDFLDAACLRRIDTLININ